MGRTCEINRDTMESLELLTVDLKKWFANPDALFIVTLMWSWNFRELPTKTFRSPYDFICWSPITLSLYPLSILWLPSLYFTLNLITYFLRISFRFYESAIESKLSKFPWSKLPAVAVSDRSFNILEFCVIEKQCSDFISPDC